MANDEMFVTSLRNRIRAMNVLWERAVSDMTLEQVNHHEREGVLPMAFSFSHYIKAQDQSISRVFLREEQLWISAGWAAKVGVNIDALGREETVEEMQHLDPNAQAWLDKARELSKKVHHHLREEETKFFQVSGKIVSATQKQRLAKSYRRDYLRMHKQLAAK